MCRRTRESSPTGFGCTGEVCTTLNVSIRQCTAPKRLANMDGGCAKNRSLTLVKKKLTSLLQTSRRLNIKSMVKFYSKEGRSRRHKYPARSLDLQHNLVTTSHFQTWKAIKFYCTFNNFREFVVQYKLNDNNPLIILTYSTNKFYHLLLDSSKHLQRIKLSKFNDLQDYASFYSYHYHMQHFLFQHKHQ